MTSIGRSPVPSFRSYKLGADTVRLDQPLSTSLFRSLHLRANSYRRKLLQARTLRVPTAEASRYVHPTVFRERLVEEERRMEPGGGKGVWR